MWRQAIRGGRPTPRWYSSATFLPSLNSTSSPEFEKVVSGCAVRRYPVPDRVNLADSLTCRSSQNVMSEIVLQLEYSVEAVVSPDFAWRFRTDVANWIDPPAKFVLDAPFEVGSCGTTLMPGQEPMRWRITEIQLGKSFVLEMQLDRATLAFA